MSRPLNKFWAALCVASGLLPMLTALLVALLLWGCTDDPTPPDASSAQVPARYIVSVERGTRPGLVATGEGITARFLWDAVGMFSADLTPGQVAALRARIRPGGDVRSVTPDGVVSIPPNERVGVRAAGAAATWGLDRIDQRSGGDGQYNPPGSGQGVPAYIIDTGIRCDHVELVGRCSLGFDVFGGNGADAHGHGTHVAGTVAGATYGVAKQARVVSVRVLDSNGFGSCEGTVAGIDWAMTQPRGVLNMSLTGPVGCVPPDAIARATDAGYVVAVAAGNSSGDACFFTPAGAPAALTVGASDEQDFLAWFSNFGPCVDVFAPGNNTLSAYFTSPTATAVMSGTSMASPHAAGAAAILMQRFPTLTAPQIIQRIKDVGTVEVVKNAQTPDARLLYVLDDVQDPRPPNQLPVIQWTHSCLDQRCTFTSTSFDPDGSIVACGWSYGYDGIGSTCTPQATFTYPLPGIYRVMFDAYDDRAGYAALARDITVGGGAPPPPPPPPPPPATITLTVTTQNTKGVKDNLLTWAGSGAASMDVKRDGARIATVPNSGAYLDDLNRKGSVSFAYQVCEVGTSVCSAVVRP